LPLFIPPMTVIFGICGNYLAREVRNGTERNGTDPLQLNETGDSAIAE
jgi:hypothetical protein